MKYTSKYWIFKLALIATICVMFWPPPALSAYRETAAWEALGSFSLIFIAIGGIALILVMSLAITALDRVVDYLFNSNSTVVSIIDAIRFIVAIFGPICFGVYVGLRAADNGTSTLVSWFIGLAWCAIVMFIVDQARDLAENIKRHKDDTDQEK